MPSNSLGDGTCVRAGRPARSGSGPAGAAPAAPGQPAHQLGVVGGVHLRVGARWPRPTGASARPGAPPSEKTSSPESSATVGRPLSRAKYSALRRALASKLSPSSSGSSGLASDRARHRRERRPRCPRPRAPGGSRAACPRSGWRPAASPAERLSAGRRRARAMPRSARSSSVSSCAAGEGAVLAGPLHLHEARPAAASRCWRPRPASLSST